MSRDVPRAGPPCLGHEPPERATALEVVCSWNGQLVEISQRGR